MRHFLFVVSLLIASVFCQAQNSWHEKMIDSLGKVEFYLIAQLHNNQANTIIEKELLFSLNKKYGLQYDILEYGHSVAFLVNQYLVTGQDSLLKFIDPKASFQFIRAVKAYNDSLTHQKKIRFYGLDFENRLQGRFIKKTMTIILKQSNLPAKENLFTFLQDIIVSDPGNLAMNLKRLRNYLSQHEQDSRTLLGDYFTDVLLIANAQYDFTPDRDDAMLENFKRLHKELTKNGERPLFFASFGTGHVNLRNSNGIAMKLLEDEDSPVKNSVAVTGTHYFNCLFTKQAVKNHPMAAWTFYVRKQFPKPCL
ncbi:MAG TPA: hypothetical protein VF476_18130 [Chitinophagaceae bacterium]